MDLVLNRTLCSTHDRSLHNTLPFTLDSVTVESYGIVQEYEECL